MGGINNLEYNPQYYINQINDLQRKNFDALSSAKASKVAAVVVTIFASIALGLGLFLIGIGSTSALIATGLNLIPVILGTTITYLGIAFYIPALILAIYGYYKQSKLAEIQKTHVNMELMFWKNILAAPNPEFNLDTISNLVALDKRIPLVKPLSSLILPENKFENEQANLLVPYENGFSYPLEIYNLIKNPPN